MKKYAFQQIRDKNLLLYEYIRGSHLYGLNTPESDVDTGGVFLAPFEQLMGLGLDYQDQIASEKNDDVWYEMTKFMRLLLKSNPTILESLYVDKSLIISDVHPMMKEILANRDMFVTQACFKPFGAYAIEQIRKARGLNKRIVNPVTERLQPLDFAYTFYKQGSTKIENWLEYRGLKQQYCGLVHVPNCHQTFGVYYDFGNHILNEGITAELLQQVWIDNLDKEHSDDISKCDPIYKFMRYAMGYLHCSAHLLWVKLTQIKPIGYKGMVGEDKLSNELRLSSVSKGETPICHMTYNKDGYTEHCKDYKADRDWEKNRNPVRYESNLNKNYDSKNMMACMRLITVCTEIANGEGFNLKRTHDREFLLKIKNHGFEYDELIEIVEEKKKEMDKAIENSTIPKAINVDFVNDLLINIRKKQFNINF